MIERYMMEEEGWAIDGRNVVFGMGGNLLQNVNRDTHKFAFKCSAAMGPDGLWYDVYKDPKTMSSKASKRGRLSLVAGKTVPMVDDDTDMLEDVFVDGDILRTQSFEDIRAVSMAPLMV